MGRLAAIDGGCSPLPWCLPTCQLANLPTFRLVGLLGSWWVVVRVLRSVSRKEGGERRKERQFTGGAREKKCERRGVDTEWGV